MKKRNWPGSPVCSFCDGVETANHLFFECSVSRVVWGTVGSILGTNLCPNNIWQAMAWAHAFMPGLDKLHMVLIAAVCWGVWKARNNVTFEEHKLRSPCEILFHISSLVTYWSGMHKKKERDMLQVGASKLLERSVELVRVDRRHGAHATSSGAFSSI